MIESKCLACQTHIILSLADCQVQVRVRVWHIYQTRATLNLTNYQALVFLNLTRLQT